MRFTGHLHRGFVVVFLSLTFAVLGQAGREARAVDREPSTPAIYLQHVGSSDKPIFPIVFSAAEVSQAERSLVLGEEARFARVVLLPTSKYAILAKGVAARLAKASERSTAGDFGTFRATLVSASGRNAGILGAVQVVPILQQAQGMMASTDRAGIERVAALERRLGGGGTR